MGLAQGELPLQRNGQIETRPLHIEEWLETLPYADFQRSGQLLHQAMAATNQMTLKAGIRAELQELYNQPYRYYLRSQISAGAQHTLSTMESMQQQLRLMKQLAADLALMSRLVVNEAGNSRSLWGKKQPLPAVQQAVTYLSQALIFNFLEYGPTPRHVWKQLHSLYRFAESIGKTRTSIPLHGGGQTTIAHTYCRIILTALVDPYHLPFGAIWEIYEQVDSWLCNADLLPYCPQQDTAGRFVIDLNSDNPATAYDRFAAGKMTDDYRLLDATALYQQAQQTLEQILHGGAVTGLRLSENYRRLLLGQMNRAWHLPPKRYFPRSHMSGTLLMTRGLMPTHFHLNKGSDFLDGLLDCMSEETDGLAVEDSTPATTSRVDRHYAAEEWNLLNKSHSGCALAREQQPLSPVRVGDLIGLGFDIDSGNTHWQLGIIRWLMIDRSRRYRIGAQMLGNTGRPVALRIKSHGGELQRGFLITNNGELSMITERGVLRADQIVEVLTADGQETVRILQPLEEIAGCEYFSVRAQ